MTIQLTDLLNQVVSRKIDALQEERRKSMHSTSKRAQALAQPQTVVSPEVLGQRAKKEAEAQRAMELARAEMAKRKGRGSETADAIAAAKAELQAQLSADKEARASGKPSLKRVDIATQTSDDDDNAFYAPAAGMRKTRDAGQDGDEDRILSPDQLGSRSRLGMDESSHDSDEEHSKKLGRDIKRYEKGGKSAHKAALASAKKREARDTKGDK